MCLYPTLITNRKYVSNKKNGGIIPTPPDKRVLYVPAACGKCMECKKMKAKQWSVRLQEEIKTDRKGKFVTLTFSNESIKELAKEINGLTGYELDNQIATLAVRRYLERWRKKHKISVKHWLITELGQPSNKHQGTENLHLHGIIFSDNKIDIVDKWGYGFVYIGDYVSERTINYCMKYVMKADPTHPNYRPKILCSAGIGSNYINTLNALRNKYKGKETIETYATRNGAELGLPTYYRNKLYTDEEREKLWLEKLNKEVRYVDGTEVDVSKGFEQYEKLVKQARIKAKRLGYADNSKDWQKINYENKLRELKILTRIAKANK